jgi:GDP-L-fucose synthase
MTTLILGGSGLVGSALKRLMQIQCRSYLAPSSNEVNLLDVTTIKQFLKENTIDTVFFAAAKVGGVGANIRDPYGFIAENLQMELNFLTCAKDANIPRLIFVSSSCVYPELAELPIKEKALMSGALSTSVQPYALAKIAGMELVKIVNQKMGLKWFSVIPANVYGINDNFRQESSHVVASILRKTWDAMAHNKRNVHVWGSPENTRDFLFADDLAKSILYLEDIYFESEPINISNSIPVTIRELTITIAETMHFQGDYIWDEGSPSGTSKKVLDNSKLVNFGYNSFSDLNYGIREVHNWLNSHSSNGLRNIRWD